VVIEKAVLNNMRIGFDASNIRAGGGLTHLSELLKNVRQEVYGWESAIVWGGKTTIERLPEAPWLHRIYEPALDRALPFRWYWQRFRLEQLATVSRCDLLFTPGGTYGGGFRPFVTMSQNMLPFESHENQRFGFTWNRLRYFLLQKSQVATFNRADGLVFLSDHAQITIEPYLKDSVKNSVTTIPHGVDERFRCEPRKQADWQTYSEARPFRLLYVSIINLYKHQWHVAEAVGRLRQEGFPVAVDFVGPAYKLALQRLQQVQKQWDPAGEFIRYVGPIPYKELPERYRQADTFIFASSCENMPNILLEAMASGLPIACSNRGPMPEMLGDAGLYFDTESPLEMTDALRSLIIDAELRQRLAWGAYEKARHYSWQRCADETFAFLAQAAQHAHSS
jgi:glycosyltransferase involved in cell wall biosynthesis